MKCRSDFANILEQNNGSNSQIFQKALDQEITRSKFGRLIGHGSRSREKVVWASKDEKLRHNRIRRRKKAEASNSGFTARVSPRRKLAQENGQNRESKGRTPKQNLKQNSTSVEKTNCRTSGHGLRKSLKHSSPEEGGQRKSCKQDWVLRKHKENGQSTDGEANGKIPEQGRASKKRKPSCQNAEVPEGSKTLVKKPKPNSPKSGKTSKRGGKQNKLNQEKLKEREAKSKVAKQIEHEMDSPTCVTTALGKSPESSARRMRVMQSLGLSAPSGSVFN